MCQSNAIALMDLSSRRCSSSGEHKKKSFDIATVMEIGFLSRRTDKERFDKDKNYMRRVVNVHQQTRSSVMQYSTMALGSDKPNWHNIYQLG
jgi:hypothetical protein